MFDYHVHTVFSDGERTAAEVIDLALAQGITHLALTDHFDPFDSSLNNREKTVDDLKRHFEAIRSYAKGKAINVYCGIETCCDDDGFMRLPNGTQQLCDIVIASPHYIEKEIACVKGGYFNDEYWKAYKAKLIAMATNSGADVLGHPEGYLPIKPMLGDGTTYLSRQEICRSIAEKYFDAEFIDELGDALVKSGTAYELHGATATPREWVVEHLNRKGVRFSMGSDAHAVNILGKNERAWELYKKYSLKIIEL